MTTTHCPVCEDLPRGPLCRTHRQELAKTIHELRLGLDELKRMERREIRHSTHGGGAASPAFPQAPMDMTAADLYDYAEDIIQDTAADIGLWGGKAPQVLNRLTDKFDRLADAPNSGRDYRNLTRTNRKIRQHITPPEDRIIHGPCLNPECKAQLAGLPDDTTATCRECGSVWAVSEVRRARRERLKGHTITGTPTQIAKWVRGATGAPAKAQNVKDWLRRGQVRPESKAGKGIYECDMGSLLAAVEQVHPGVNLAA